MNLPLSHQRQRLFYYWFPSIITGVLSWPLFVFVGNTPVLRSAGLALAVMAVTLTLRRLGAVLAITGGLAMALCPAFWMQMGGAPGAVPANIALILGALGIAAVIILALSPRPYIVMLVAIVVLGALFFGQFGIARSLRITVLASAWLIYLLVNAVLETNPRPDGPPPARLKAQYRAGLLLLLVAGIINDPLFVLFMPAVVMGLFFSKTRIPYWYWAIVIVITALGIRGIVVEYINPTWWNYPVALTADLNKNIPFLIFSGWREPMRWFDMFALLAQQFTIVGVFLGVLGLARMARWYPVLGIVMMTLWGTFFTFGLVYFGIDRSILLLPLFMIQIVCITYAVYVIGQWLEKFIASRMTSRQNARILRVLVPFVYMVLPLWLLLEILR